MRGIQLRHTLGLGAATAILFVLVIAFGPRPAQSLGPDSVLLGAAVHGDEAHLIDDLEADVGRQLDAVRIFKLWDEPFPSPDDAANLDGRRIIVSIKPKEGGTRIPWADIAAAQPGDPIHDEMVRWAADLAPYEDQLYLNFHHEPEASANLSHGVDTEYIAAWQRFMTVMDEEGLQPLGRVWIMTDYSYHLPTTERRHAEKWYPGDDWVDAASIDAYNWHHCRQGIFTNWMPLGDIISPFRVWGQSHPALDLMLTEFASVEDPVDPNRKAAWIDDARATMQNGSHDQFKLVAYFDLEDPAGTGCDWRVSTSAESMAAFSRLANDPYFGGTGDPLPPTTTTTTTAPPVQACTLAVDGSTATLSWLDDGGTFVVRRNGSWLATPGSGSSGYVDDPSPAGATYELRIWDNDGRRDLPCEAGGPPPTTTTTSTSTTSTSTTSTSTTTSTTTTTTTSTTTTTTTTAPPPPTGCTVERVGNDNVLSWVDDGGRHVVRRDGSWLATPGKNVSSYTDVGGPADAIYELRIWDNGRVDHPCV